MIPKFVQNGTNPIVQNCSKQIAISPDVTYCFDFSNKSEDFDRLKFYDEMDKIDPKIRMRKHLVFKGSELHEKLLEFFDSKDVQIEVYIPKNSLNPTQDFSWIY